MQQRFTVVETLPPSKLKGVAHAPSGFVYKYRLMRAGDTSEKRRLKGFLRFSQLLFTLSYSFANKYEERTNHSA